MMWGLNPGPLLFTNNAEFAWGLIASLFVANIVALIIAMSIIPHLVKILAVPVKYMIPIIPTVCFVGAYATSQSMYGVIVMVLSGIAGYFFKKADLPVAPMLLTFVLSPIFESNMRRAFISSGGSLGIFVGSPLSTVFLVITLLLVCSPAIKAAVRKARGQKAK
jgi:putative tricarboxylic transport membrane protein